MKMKRFLAILLVLAMCLTTLGVVPAMAVEPAAEESDDAISARWTDQDSLPPRIRRSPRMRSRAKFLLRTKLFSRATKTPSRPPTSSR